MELTGTDQNHRQAQDDCAAVRGHIGHASSGLAADKHGERTEDDDVGRADTHCHVANASRWQAAYKNCRAARRKNRAADMRHEHGNHRTDVHIGNASGRHTHG